MIRRHWFRPQFKNLVQNLVHFFLLSFVMGMTSLPVQAQVVAQAQFSEEQIKRYAGAASAIEQKRDEILRRAKTYNGWQGLTERADAQGVFVCSLKKSEQPAVIQGLCSELFEFSEQEIRRHGFANNRDFNQMTQAQQQNLQLQKRIQDEILRPRK